MTHPFAFVSTCKRTHPDAGILPGMGLGGRGGFELFGMTWLGFLCKAILLLRGRERGGRPVLRLG